MPGGQINNWGVDTSHVHVGAEVLLANVLHAVGVVATVERMDSAHTGWAQAGGVRLPFHVASVMEVREEEVRDVRQ